MKNKIFGFIICICLLKYSFSQNLTSTKGKEFWFSFMENLNLGINREPKFSVIISADENCTVHITVEASSFDAEVDLMAGETKQFTLPGTLYPIGSEATTNFGCHITSTKPISIKSVHARAFYTDASIVYPVELTGTQYKIITIPDARKLSPNSFIIVSQEDNTKINITPSVETLFGRSANKKFTITLQKGQTYQVQAMGDLSNSFIESEDNKKIVVISGAKQVYLYSNVTKNLSPDNHLYEQQLPLQFAGNEFVYIPLAVIGGDPIKLLINENNTKIFINGKLLRIMNAGIFDTLLLNPTLINTNKPIQIAQFITGVKVKDIFYELGAPNLFYLQSTNLKGYNECFKTHDGIFNWDFQKHFVTVIGKTTDTASFTLDKIKIRPGFKSIGNNLNLMFASIPVSKGVHCISMDSGFNAYAYGYGEYDAYSYSLGFGANELQKPIQEEVVEVKYKLFPNPTNKDLFIQFNIPKNTQAKISYTLFDAVSKKIIDKKYTVNSIQNKIKIPMEEYAAACYFLQINVENQKENKAVKIIKITK